MKKPDDKTKGRHKDDGLQGELRDALQRMKPEDAKIAREGMERTGALKK